jgi:hypothetical protein
LTCRDDRPARGWECSRHGRHSGSERTLRVEAEGWVNPELTARDADVLGHRVAAAVEHAAPGTGSFTWAPGSLT